MRLLHMRATSLLHMRLLHMRAIFTTFAGDYYICGRFLLHLRAIATYAGITTFAGATPVEKIEDTVH